MNNEDLKEGIVLLANSMLDDRKKTVFCIPIPEEIKLQLSYRDSDGNKQTLILQDEIIMEYWGRIRYCDKKKGWFSINHYTEETRDIYEFIQMWLTELAFE